MLSHPVRQSPGRSFEMPQGQPWVLGSGTLPAPASPCVPAGGDGLSQGSRPMTICYSFSHTELLVKIYIKNQVWKVWKRLTIRLNPPTFACLIKPFTIWTCTLISGHSPDGAIPAVQKPIQLPACAQAVPSLHNSLPRLLHLAPASPLGSLPDPPRPSLMLLRLADTAFYFYF